MKWKLPDVVVCPNSVKFSLESVYETRTCLGSEIERQIVVCVPTVYEGLRVNQFHAYFSAEANVLAPSLLASSQLCASSELPAASFSCFHARCNMRSP
jgi:hypothetical protein